MRRGKSIIFFTSAILATSIFASPIAEASTYTVGKGDTLTKIAKTNKTTVQQIKEWNHLASDTIYVGQQLVVSSKTVGTTTTQTNKPIVKQPVGNEQVKGEQTTNTSSYKVVKGDNLTKIAKKYAVTVADLKKWNQLTSDNIFEGQVLKIQNSLIPEVDEQLTDQVVIEAGQGIDQHLAGEAAIPYDPTLEGLTLYDQVIEIANSLVGTPYQFGGNTPEGFDCSGFVRYVFSNAGIDIVRKSSKDYFMNDTTLVESPVPGDVVFFKDTYITGISHMGIYLGDGVFVHAGSEGVELSRLDYDYWKSKFVAFKRFNQVL